MNATMSRVVLIAGFAVLFAGSTSGQPALAQSDSQPTTQQAPAPAQDKPAAKAPKAKSNTAKPGPSQTPASDDAATPASAPEPPAKKSSAEDNPFPEDISKKAQDAAQSESAPPREGQSGPPRSSEDDSNPAVSSSNLHLEDLGSGENVATEPDPKRARKDLDVGGFYMQTGNYKGAYERYKEAVVLAPDDAEAAYALAEAARKLNLTSEAIQNYHHSLELDPDGPKAKAAKKALASLGKNEKQ